MPYRRRLLVPAVWLSTATAFAAACGSGTPSKDSGATGTGGTGTTTTAMTGVGAAGPTNLSLPQFVHGAAYADTTLFPTIPVVISVTGVTPEDVAVTIDSNTTVVATQDANGYVAMIPVSGLAPGVHTLLAQAGVAGSLSGEVQGKLTVGSGSLEFTHVASDGVAYDGHLVHDTAADVLDYTWVDVPGNAKHQLFLNHLDGAFQRLLPGDVVLNDPADEPLSGYTAFGPSGIGVVYMTAQPNDPQWLVKMRVVDPTGKTVIMPTMDLTQGQAAYSIQAAGADPGGFSAAWLHISPAPDGGAPPPVELRFSRWDTTANELVGPIVLDSDQPQAAGSAEGPQSLEPLGEINIACNATLCLVAYVRDVYDTEVQLNEPKVFVAAVDLQTGMLAAPPAPVEASNWDAQLFGNHLVTQADGSFVLVYQAVDTAAAVNPITACDDTEERDLLVAVKIDATGKIMGTPAPIFDFQGSREYPRIAALPEGFALLWEDQRSECAASGGHIGMAANTVSADLSMLLDPYVELPSSIGIPPEDPTLAATGTSFVVAWSDNRHGMGLLQDDDEIYLDTYWHK
jgi:hypothetical protein